MCPALIHDLYCALHCLVLQLVGPLVHERDLYLAWSLKRSKAVNGARTVVGVVGRGHLRGVCYALTHDAGERGGRIGWGWGVGGVGGVKHWLMQRSAAEQSTHLSGASSHCCPSWPEPLLACIARPSLH